MSAAQRTRRRAASATRVPPHLHQESLLLVLAARPVQRLELERHAQLGAGKDEQVAARRVRAPDGDGRHDLYGAAAAAEGGGAAARSGRRTCGGELRTGAAHLRQAPPARPPWRVRHQLLALPSAYRTVHAPLLVRARLRTHRRCARVLLCCRPDKRIARASLVAPRCARASSQDPRCCRTSSRA